MAEYDLTGKFLQHVDRHLALPMIQFLSGTELFNEADLSKALYELVRGTDMAQFASELHQTAYPGQPVPDDLQAAVKAVAEKEKVLESAVQPAIKAIEDPTVLSSLTNDKQRNLRHLSEKHGLSLENINALYRYGSFQFNSGNYDSATSYLYHFRVFSTDPALTLSTYWGKLAADTLLGNWDDALAELKLLRDQVDGSGPNSANADSDSAPSDTLQCSANWASQGGVNEQLLKKRVWLLHWSLFVYFNHPQGLETLVGHFFNPAYLSAVQTSAPWLLRYLVVALIMTRRTSRVYQLQQSTAASTERSNKLYSNQALRELVKALQAEEDRREEEEVEPTQPKDPVLKFVLALLEDFDFEAAQAELAKAQQVVENDFFLAEHVDAFVESARWLISELYCGIHHRVDITDLSKRLNLSPEEGEKWIVNLIRESNVDAKIDLQERMVYMNQKPEAMYGEVIDKTKGYVFRTSAMGQAMERKVRPHGAAPAHQEKNSSAAAAQGVPAPNTATSTEPPKTAPSANAA